LINKLIYLIFIIFIFANNSFAEKDTLYPFFDKSDIEIRKINNDKLIKYKNNNEFDYFKTYNNPETIWDYIKYWFWRTIDYIFSNKNPIGIAIKYILIISFIIIIIMFLTKNKFKSLFFKEQKVTNEIYLNELNDNINKINIPELIRQAKSDKNWKLAVRYYYLYLLKELSKNNIIEWKINKTNHNYINELKKSEFYETFKELSKIYNYIWYGDFVIDETSFIEINVKFDKTIQKINKQKNINE